VVRGDFFAIQQVESAQKKGDSVKTYTLAQELNSQLAMKEHLNKRVESHDEKMYKHKVKMNG
jgi:predicted component of type VI protein secretion system